MKRVRGALVLASLEQYAGILINFLLMAILSRLLTPAEVGVAAVAVGITAVFFSLREFATPEFLIQQARVGPDEARTAFTLFFLVSLLLAVALAGASSALAQFYDHEQVTLFLLLMTVSMMGEAVSTPIMSLLRREMAFGRIAAMRSAGAVVTAIVSVSFALLGFGFLSIAIGSLAGSIVTAIIAILTRPKMPLFRPSFARWHTALDFGRFRGAAMAVERVYESLPQLVLGRLLPMASVGIYNRSISVSSIPDRALLSSILSVAYPALSEALREGRDIKAAYLKALQYITAVYWPALILLAILAEPAVLLILGPNWPEAVPLVRIITLANLFWFPAPLTYPILAAVGANRDAFLANLAGRLMAAFFLCSSSLFGLTAMALSQFINLPLQMVISFSLIRRRVPFEWADMARALAPSAIVTAAAMAGPAVLVIARGFSFDFPFEVALAAVGLSGTGWLAGVFLVRHPIAAEILRVARLLGGLAGWRRLAPGVSG